MKSILFSSAGRRVALMQCFREDARRLGIGLRLLAADVKPELSAACQTAAACFAVPHCLAADFVPAMLELCDKQGVDVVIPTIDTELAALAASRDAFSEVGTTVVIPSLEVVALANDKLATARKLDAAGIPTPRSVEIFSYVDAPEKFGWPVLVKPNNGSASKGIINPSCPEEVLMHRERSDLMVQEFWQGREYTVNVFFDGSGRLRCAVPHRRIEVRSGEVSKGRTERIGCLVEAAQRIASCLSGARGPLCFQAIVREDGSYAIIELNARFGGGYPLAHSAGARFSQWLLEEAMGWPCTANDDWREGVTMLRYDSAVFLDV